MSTGHARSPRRTGGQGSQLAPGLRGDLASLFSPSGTYEGRPTLSRAVQRALTRPGPLAILLYRVSHALWRRGAETPAELLWRLGVFLTGADIHPAAEIGGGLRITHTVGLVVGSGVRIGANVTLLHGVTLGGSGRGEYAVGGSDGFPVVEDDCFIAAGAKVLGPIRIGRGSFVGANAVVGKDLPEESVYIPGRELAQLERRLEDAERRIADLESRPADGGEQPGP